MLSDAHSRAIYDIFGKKGLEVEGWEVCILSDLSSCGFAALLNIQYIIDYNLLQY